ncbi:MAG TPA: hypothetical protein ENO00_14820 [Deltaproteobacteria bacterium]|nr:hypothetical protein [Deltaproteobacteria bacterium]
MSVKKRLQRLTGETRPDDARQTRKKQMEELRQRIDLIMSRRSSQVASPSMELRGNAVNLPEVVSGEEIENEYGTFYLVQRKSYPSTSHGNRCIHELSSIDMEAAALLANEPDLAGCSCTDGLYLDTETTGLAGGTGTFAFLIGIGWFKGTSFITQQIFARDFSEERAGLSFLQDAVRGKQFLVTFNGKAFDVGLLSARFIMNRLSDPLVGLSHLDLLHPSRRLVGHRLENSRLGTIERTVLGLQRYGDVPGSEIPQRYFDWLRRRDGRLMEDVFEHNRLDVISMATLTLHLTELLGKHPDHDCLHHGDLLAAARLFHDRGDGERACRFLEPLLSSNNRVIADEARKYLSLIYKRAGRWHDAIALWEMMIAGDHGNVFAAVELAKWYEHRENDYTRALSLINQILPEACHLSQSDRDGLMYRLNRLKRRLTGESS